MRIHTLTVVVCLLAGSGTAAAQNHMQVGVIGGPSAATFTATADSNPPDFTSHAGFSAGLFLVSPVRHHTAFEPEALFTRRGGNSTEGATDVRIRVTSIDIPLLLRFQSTGTGRASAHFVTGPVAAFRLTANQTLSNAGGTTETDVKDQSRGAAMMFAVGGGVDAGRFRLDGRYTWALTHLNTNTSGGFNVKSHELTILAGIIF